MDLAKVPPARLTALTQLRLQGQGIYVADLDASDARYIAAHTGLRSLEVCGFDQWDDTSDLGRLPNLQEFASDGCHYMVSSMLADAGSLACLTRLVLNQRKVQALQHVWTKKDGLGEVAEQLLDLLRLEIFECSETVADRILPGVRMRGVRGTPLAAFATEDLDDIVVSIAALNFDRWQLLVSKGYSRVFRRI